ncbi:MBOAT family O-acyltransferase [Leptotrichia sp. oral taxon 847]|uniref:MBOAT family O-acyltransferase n=1 Tax=Leptotrichia sp. oral taxon 847 TaxID=1785996 RepID=UPI00076806AC|nr:MBOAT family O-acyltransferase [Leptotrichia sp. oral taxon 847]AMD95131.1 alginate O-acetyltransferase [Leptotrichia sp. oral taxon 847]
MVFTSSIFLFLFLPITLFGYYFINPKFKNGWLFLMSLIFYSWSGIYYALLFLFSAYVNYLFGLWMSKNNETKTRKLILSCSLIWNLGLLFFFKYFSFVLVNFEKIVKVFIPTFVIEIPKITLPVGISFFTFQIMSYIIDLYRNQIQVQRKFTNLGLYIMLFPQLIAGPIVRYIDVEKEINDRKVSIDLFDEGIRRFILGFSKKILIANTMGAWADIVFNTPWDKMSSPMAWLGVFGYSMQIFFDFSAYSDMAIGLGKMLGFNFLENFNYPYCSTSIQEFWRRWHMSLSQWFRDYLYIPLGGNRKGEKRTYINLVIVFFCTGLWHGASWNFVIWGLFHVFFIILERIKLKKTLERVPKILQRVYLLLVISISWVFFRSDNVLNAIIYIKRLFFFKFDHLEYFIIELENWKLFIALLAILFSTPLIPKIEKYLLKKLKSENLRIIHEIIVRCGYIIIFIIAICFMFGENFNPFIYFRF